MQNGVESYGGLHCRIVQHRAAEPSPDLVVVLMHGFGASGSDLVPIGGEVLEASSRLARSTRFVFPEAPLDLTMRGMPGSRAWWWIDVEEIYESIETRAILDPATREAPPEGIDEARATVRALLRDVRADTGVGASRIVLGGFSQGAMLACDVTLREEEPPAGLVLWSAMPICVADWRRLAPRRAGLRVFQSHGRMDPLLPYPLAEELRDLLEGAGLGVRFVPFPGMHGIAAEVLRAWIEWIEPITPSRSLS